MPTKITAAKFSSGATLVSSFSPRSADLYHLIIAEGRIRRHNGSANQQGFDNIEAVFSAIAQFAVAVRSGLRFGSRFLMVFSIICRRGREFPDLCLPAFRQICLGISSKLDDSSTATLTLRRIGRDRMRRTLDNGAGSPKATSDSC